LLKPSGAGSPLGHHQPNDSRRVYVPHGIRFQQHTHTRNDTHTNYTALFIKYNTRLLASPQVTLITFPLGESMCTHPPANPPPPHITYPCTPAVKAHGRKAHSDIPLQECRVNPAHTAPPDLYSIPVRPPRPVQYPCTPAVKAYGVKAHSDIPLQETNAGVGRYTTLPSPIMYGACHEKRGSVGGAYIAQWSCNSIAIG